MDFDEAYTIGTTCEYLMIFWRAKVTGQGLYIKNNAFTQAVIHSGGRLHFTNTKSQTHINLTRWLGCLSNLNLNWENTGIPGKAHEGGQVTDTISLTPIYVIL